MNKGLPPYISSVLIAIAMLLSLAHTMATEKNDKKAVKSANGSGEYSEKVPDFSLKDPLGVAKDGASLYAPHGMLIMVTVPNLTQYEKQKCWDKCIGKLAWPENAAPRRVLLEDLSQQETFKDRVRSMMAKNYDPKGETTVIVDEDGGVRRSFGVQNNETVILLVDAKGNVIHHEADCVEPDMEAARRLIGQVRVLSENSRATGLIQSAGEKRMVADTPPLSKN